MLMLGIGSSAFAQQEKNELSTDVTILSRAVSGENESRRVNVTKLDNCLTPGSSASGLRQVLYSRRRP